MPTRVACPTCGTDGTPAANDTIARLFPTAPSPIVRLIEMPAQPVATAATIQSPTPAPLAIATAVESPVPALRPATSPTRLTVSLNSHPPAEAAHAPAARRPDPRLGLVDRNQAEHEARAKAMWGDTKEQIVSYLMIQGFSAPEATELATKLFKERTAAVRSNGIRKIIIGIGLMCVPVIAAIFFLAIGMFLLKPFAAAVMVGLWGAWLFINGLLMAIAPKSERGDVADQ